MAGNSDLAPEGRVRPRVDACDDCSPWFMVQEHLTVRDLRRCKGVLPRVRGGPWPPWGRVSPRSGVGRGPARQGARVGRRGRSGWDLARLACYQPRATEGRVRPRGDASDDGSAWFMVQNTPTFRVLLRCKGVLPGGGRTRPGAPRRLIPGQGGALVGTMRTLPVISPAHQRDASDLGWTPATIVPLDLWCKIPRRPAPCNIARASSRGEVGRGPARQGA